MEEDHRECLVPHSPEGERVLTFVDRDLQTFSSITYLPLHTKIYKHWLMNNWVHREWDHWLMMGLIGFFVGLLGSCLKVSADRPPTPPGPMSL
jgi:hypothetical protein